MSKYLPIVIPIIALIVVGVALRLLMGSQSPPRPVPGTLPDSQLSTPKSSTEDRLKTLEEVMAALIQKVNGTSGSTAKNSLISAENSSGASTKELEVSINDLKNRVSALENLTPTPTTTAATSTKYPVYIPMGNSYSLNNDNWNTVEYYEAVFDPADYSGYTGVQLEISLRVMSSLGKAYARLYNNSDGSAVSSSEISTNSDKFVLLSSSSVKLDNTKKYYRVQVKSQGYEAFFENPRLKVNF